jgi:uncharacterized protein
MGGLLRFLLLVIFIWMCISVVRRLVHLLSLPRQGKEQSQNQEGMLLVQDPQCGRFVPEQDTLKISFHGQGLHFCSQECRDLYIRLKTLKG